MQVASEDSVINDLAQFVDLDAAKIIRFRQARLVGITDPIRFDCLKFEVRALRDQDESTVAVTPHPDVHELNQLTEDVPAGDVAGLAPGVPVILNGAVDSRLAGIG